MTPNEIRNTGLIEYYVLGLLSDEDHGMVERYMDSFPELKADILEIERLMQLFARDQGIVPKSNLAIDILHEIRINANKQKAHK